MVQQCLNYGSERYFYPLFERLFELIHRVSGLYCRIVQCLSFYGTKEDNRALLKHKRFDWT